MKDKIKEKQLNEVLYGLDYIGNKIKNDDGKLELGVNNCKLLLDYITNLQEENERLSVELNKNMIERNNCLSRNEKAIEFIEMYNVYFNDNLDKKVDHIYQKNY